LTDFFARAIRSGDDAEIVPVQQPRPGTKGDDTPFMPGVSSRPEDADAEGYTPLHRKFKDDISGLRQQYPDALKNAEDKFERNRTEILRQRSGQKAPSTDYFGRAIRGDAPAQPEAQAMPSPVSKLGTTRGDRVREAIMGKTDPEYGKLPNISTVLQNEGGLSYGGEMGRWAVGASDDDMAKGYGRMLGDRFQGIEKDANGYPVIAYRGKDGKDARAYVNNPGLDMQDVARGVTGALPFAKTAQVIGAMGQGAPIAGRMLAQAAGQAGTSLAQDATAVATDVSPLNPVHSLVKAGVSAAGGAGGELIGEGVNILAQSRRASRLFDKGTQTLTPEGQAAAQAAGMDPAELTGKVAQDFAKTFAKTGDPDTAIRQTVSNEFGIRRTAGEMSGNKGQLLREQQMRGTTYGDPAAAVMKNFDDLQKADIARATRGVVPDGSRSVSIAERIAPARRDQLAGERMGKTEAGENLAGNNQAAFGVAKELEDAAWKRVPTMKATPESLAEINESIAAKFSEVSKSSGRPLVIDEEITPMATKMSKALEDFQAGRAPAKASSILPENTVGDTDTMRRRLLEIKNKAADETDRRAANALYGAYLDWQVVAAEKSGDIMGASLSRIAREHTRTLHEIFDGQKGTPAANLLKTVFKGADSPEQMVNAIFTGPSSQIKGGAPTAIRQMNRAYDTYLEPAAALQAKQDLGLAYWLKMTADKGNEVKTPGQLSSAIKTMLGDHKSLSREIYSPETLASMRRLAMAMDEIKQKNPNTSWSAIGIGALLKDVGTGILKMIGSDSVLGRTLGGIALKPVAGTYGKVQAGRATGGLQGATVPRLSEPTGAGIGGAFGNQSQQ
jgi:hypothetical protein